MKRISLNSTLLIILFATLSSCNNSKREADKKHYEAISDYNSSIKLYPNDAVVYYDRGVAYYNLENYAEAIRDYSTAIKLDSDFASAYHNRGIAKEYIGLHYCEDFKKACKLGDDDSCEWYDEECI